MSSTVPDAIRESLRILATDEALFRGAKRGWGVSLAEGDIGRVLDAFAEAGTRWALVGAHAINILTEPRATRDFDFIVESRKLNVVLDRLRGAFGDLDELNIGAAVRLRAIDIDLIRSTNHPLFQEAIQRTVQVGGFSVPRPEVLMVLKFLSALSPWRHSDQRAQDIVDMKRLFTALGPEGLESTLMLELSKAAYPGAEREFAELIGRIERDEPISF